MLENSYPVPGSSVPARKNKIVDVMKRSLSPRSTSLAKGNGGHAKDSSYSYFHYEERAQRVPTVEQISMGLHLSRTPHLRPTNGRGRSMSSDLPAKPDAKPTHRSRATVPLPKPALKKTSSLSAPTSNTPSFTNASTSTSTTLSSAMARTDRHDSFFPPRLFSRVTKMIPSSRGRSPREAEPDPEVSSQKKSVRFSVDDTK